MLDTRTVERARPRCCALASGSPPTPSRQRQAHKTSISTTPPRAMPRGCMGIGDRSHTLDDRPRRHRLLLVLESAFESPSTASHRYGPRTLLARIPGSMCSGDLRGLKSDLGAERLGLRSEKKLCMLLEAHDPQLGRSAGQRGAANSTRHFGPSGTSGLELQESGRRARRDRRRDNEARQGHREPAAQPTCRVPVVNFMMLPPFGAHRRCDLFPR